MSSIIGISGDERFFDRVAAILFCFLLILFILTPAQVVSRKPDLNIFSVSENRS